MAEPWVMLHPLYALKKNGIETEYVSSLARQGLDDFLMQVPEGEELYIEALREMAFVLYNRTLELSGKSFFLDKTPRYYFIIPELYRVFPKAKFIFLLRNPMAVLSSVLSTWLGNQIHALVKSPNYIDLTKGPHYLIDGINKLKEDAIVVHYEELVRKPKEVIQHVCNKIGISFYEDMLDYGQKPAPKGRLGDSVGVHKHKRPVADYIDKWVENLESPDLIEFTYNYLSNLGSELVLSMGYSYQDIKDKLESNKFNKQGESLFSKGDFEGALNAFTMAIEINPNFATAHNNLGVMYYNRGEKDKALNHYQQAAQLQPENITFQKNLADFYYVEMSQVEEAMRIYVKVLNVNPEDIDTLLILGHICVAMEKFDEAKVFYNRVLEIDFGNADARQNLDNLVSVQKTEVGDRMTVTDDGGQSLPAVSLAGSELRDQRTGGRVQVAVVGSRNLINHDKQISNTVRT